MKISDKLKDLAEKESADAAVKEMWKDLDGFEASIAEIEKAAEEKDKAGVASAKDLVEKYDALVSSCENLEKAVKEGKVWNKTSVPGMGETKESFSMIKACVAIKTNDWKGAGFEKECLDAMEEAATKSDGQSVTVPDDGGYFVPFQVIPEVIPQLFAQSVMIDLSGDTGNTRVSVADGLSGQQVTLPKFEGGMVAYWIGEEDEYALSKSKVGDIKMTPHKLGVLGRITREMRNWAGFGFENFWRRDFIKTASLKLDRTILYGPGGDNAPKGVINNKAMARYAMDPLLKKFYTGADEPGTTAGGKFTFDDAINMMGYLEDNNVQPNESFAFISHPRWRRLLQKLKIDNFSAQTENQAYLLGLPTLTEAELRELLGTDFATTTQVDFQNFAGATAGWTATNTTPNVDNHFGDVFAGNWDDVILGMWGGISIEDDSGIVNFVKDQILVKLRLYADTGHRRDEAVVWSPDTDMAIQ